MDEFNSYSQSAVTVDNVIFGFDNGDLKVLLVKRSEAPFLDHWALPGYFVQPTETLPNAARRVLKEVTGLENVYLEQVKTFGDPNRHPSGRVITVAYFSLIKIEDFQLNPTHHLAKEATWHPISSIEKLAFDHNLILNDCFETLKKQVSLRPVGFELLSPKFTLSQLQQLYEVILETQLDKRNFRKKVLTTNLLIDIDEMQEGVAHRPAKLYQFNKEKYEELVEKGFSFQIKEAKRK